jgi:hypothetical protein
VVESASASNPAWRPIQSRTEKTLMTIAKMPNEYVREFFKDHPRIRVAFWVTIALFVVIYSIDPSVYRPPRYDPVKQEAIRTAVQACNRRPVGEYAECVDQIPGVPPISRPDDSHSPSACEEWSNGKIPGTLAEQAYGLQCNDGSTPGENFDAFRAVQK